MPAIARFVLLIAASGAAVVSAQGLTTPWDLKKTLESISAYGDRLEPVIQQLSPKDWKTQGAPDGYDLQQQQALLHLRGVNAMAKKLALDTEKLTVALDLMFRLDGMDATMLSLAEGVRTYHNPAIAELIMGMRNESANARQGLKLYVVELAATKETEFKIADEEAQRCRSQNLRNRKK